MRVYAARQHEPSVGVDLAHALRQACAERGDASVRDADVAMPLSGLGREARVAHDEIQLRHEVQTSRNRRPQPCTRRVSTPASLSDFHNTVAMLS